MLARNRNHSRPLNGALRHHVRVAFFVNLGAVLLVPSVYLSLYFCLYPATVNASVQRPLSILLQGFLFFDPFSLYHHLRFAFSSLPTFEYRSPQLSELLFFCFRLRILEFILSINISNNCI